MKGWSCAVRLVASMIAFREEYHLTLGPGERIQDLIHEGHALRHH
jgi:hypothetical protein